NHPIEQEAGEAHQEKTRKLASRPRQEPSALFRPPCERGEETAAEERPRKKIDERERQHPRAHSSGEETRKAIQECIEPVQDGPDADDARLQGRGDAARVGREAVVPERVPARAYPVAGQARFERRADRLDHHPGHDGGAGEVPDVGEEDVAPDRRYLTQSHPEGSTNPPRPSTSGRHPENAPNY